MGIHAFVQRLLDVRAGQGVDGPTPLGDDVVWDARTSREFVGVLQQSMRTCSCVSQLSF